MRKIYLILLQTLVMTQLIAQKKESLTFDLGNGGGSIPSINKKVEIVNLENAFPFRTYKLNAKADIPVQDPLKRETDSGTASENCAPLKKTYTDTETYAWTKDETKSENDLKKQLDYLKSSMSSCSDEILKAKILKLLFDCTRIIVLANPLEMEESTSYTFTVEGTKEKYEYKFKGKTPGRWLMSYGFVFSSKKLEPEQYYTESNGENSFEIKKKNKAELLDLRYTPTLFWSYFFDKNLNDNWNHSVTAGLGFNTSTPVVACGYNLMFRHNIGISIGACFYEQQKLNGKYSEGQIITENLDNDQLYEKNFRPNLFFGINFRLGDNPFESKKSTSE